MVPVGRELDILIGRAKIRHRGSAQMVSEERQAVGVRHLGSVVKAAAKDFFDDQPFHLAAALSYYTLLSIAPLLLVVTSIAGLLLGDLHVRDSLIGQAEALVGREGAQLLETVSRNVGPPEESLWSMIIGLLLTLLGASTVFAQLQFALNRIWRVEAVPSNAVVGFVRARLVSLAVVLGLGFLLLVSLILSAALSGFSGYIEDVFPGAGLVSRFFDLCLSVGLIAVVLALLFRYVPDAQISWRDTTIGALITAVLFTVGKYFIGLYLGKASVGSAYGAAGSAVVFMVWVYYASLILFFGAAVTKAVARQRGHPVMPSAYARSLERA